MLNEDEGPEAKKAKFAPPTIEEVAALRESENIYSGRLSQLKVEEILNEIGLSDATSGAIRSCFETVSKDLRNATNMKPVDLENLPNKIGQVNIPMDMKPKAVKGIMKLVAPESIKLDPLFKINGVAQIGEITALNLIVKMPADCLQEKDHWDQRYFRKRAIYLAYLSNELLKLKKYKIRFSIQSGIRIKPSMIISMSHNDVAIEFHVEIAIDSFCKNSKLAQNRSNIHFDWWNSEDDSESIVPPPTPLYNSLIGQDLGRDMEAELYQEMEKRVPNFHSALKLFTLYVTQTELEFLHGKPEIFAALVRYLFHKKRIPRLASGFQIYRIILEFLATHELQRDVLFVEDEFEHFSIPALVTETGQNVLAGITQIALEWIQYSAKRDLNIINGHENGIVEVLVKKRPFTHFSSNSICFKPEHKALECVLRRNKQLQQIAAVSGDCSSLSMEYLCRILIASVSDRILAMNPRLTTYADWTTNQKAPSSDNLERPLIGLILSDSDAKNKNKLFRGPQADQSGAARFKSIWGPKTDERRFKDGQICVAVHFEDALDPIQDAIKYLFELHGKVEIDFCGQIISEISENEVRSKEYKDITEAYNQLEQVLRDPELSVPLKIQQCWPITNSLRGTSTITSKAITTHQPKSAYQPNVDVPEMKAKAPNFSENLIYLELEGSSQWPQNVAAIRKLRAAYHIRLGDILTNKFKIKSAVGDSGMAVISRVGQFIFKLVTVYKREAQIMKESICPKSGILQVRDNPRSDAAELETLIRPQLCLVLSKLNSIQMSVCRLVRKWLSAHLLTNQIDSLLSDLIVYLALNDSDCGSQVNGFYRVLHFIANYDFVDEPLFITSPEFVAVEQIELREYFSENRLELFKDHGIIISSASDKKKTLLTKNLNFGIVKKLQLLAKVSASTLDTMVRSGNLANFKNLFEGSTSWFDVVIHLNEFKCSRVKELKPKEIEKSLHRLQVPGWDLSRIFLNQLERSYGHLAWFFSEENESKLVAVKFKKTKKDMKGLEGECFGGMAKGEDGLYSNQKGLLNDFRIMGEGLVDSIIVQKEL